ncbi:cysteine proteinase [Setomelanomma holmii]|uniref:ubiquitinyl hydrolase 1 n=1 Tax=Setomelanomma holmii TaxID=210430 RepID=A0A9P4HF69_9PLEO|nr:cysteine proteinase [Setomelanomma holmii]
MDFNWPDRGDRVNEDSRGIENRLQTCYQISVHQALLHQPPLLRWLMSHYTDDHQCPAAHCVTCYMQFLVEEYWGDDNPADTVIARNNDVGSISQMSYNSGIFARGAQDDARLFYTWLADHFYEDVRGTPRNIMKGNNVLAVLKHGKLNTELSSRRTFYLDTCTACHHINKRATQNEAMINLGVLTTQATLNDALRDTWTDQFGPVDCNGCGQQQAMDRECGKIMHALSYPELLDLTIWQVIPTLPLCYRLNIVLSHHDGVGGGHYVASVRSRAPVNFSAMSDDQLEDFSRAEFLANPQRPDVICPTKAGFQVYMLMYERDDVRRSMPPAPRADGKGKSRLRRELRALIIVVTVAIAKLHHGKDRARNSNDNPSDGEGGANDHRRGPVIMGVSNSALVIDVIVDILKLEKTIARTAMPLTEEIKRWMSTLGGSGKGDL